MNQRVSMALVIAPLVLAVEFARGDASQQPVPEKVELIVQDSKGNPVTNTDLTFLSDGASGVVKTDGKGAARFEATGKIFVKAPGVGYGATGLFNLSPGELARPALPRLVPFAKIEGSVPKEFRRTGMTVKTGTMSGWLVSETLVENSGHFLLKDVAYGYGWLVAQGKDDKEPIAEASVTFEPGEHVKTVEWVARVPEPASPVSPDQVEEKPKPPVVWAEGTVHDEAGSPLEGAQVFAYAMRGFDFVSAPSVLSEADGRWQISGEPGLPMAQGQLLIYKFDFCPEFAPLRCPVHEPLTAATPPKNAAQVKQPSQPKPPAYDAVLSRRSGAMEVRVTKNGKPLPETRVSIEDEDFSRSVGFADAHRFLCPQAVTGDDGIARFADLIPGMYSITIEEAGKIGIGAVQQVNPMLATSGGAMSVSDSSDILGDNAVAFWQGAFGSSIRVPAPNYRGIVVEAGKTRAFHATIRPHAYPATIKLRNPDGKPAAGFKLFLDGQIDSEGNFDQSGSRSVRYETPGLYRLSATYVEGEHSSAGNPDNQGFYKPYCHIEGTIAASDFLRASPPVKFSSVRHRNIPGSLVVQLEDVAGKPTAGYVLVDRIHGTSIAGSTDDKGELRLEGVEPMLWSVEPVFPGLKLPQFDQYNGPFPDDKELIGRVAVFPENVECPLGRGTRIVLRPKRVGYVRGLLHPAASMRIDRYSIEDFGVPKSGRFLAGPFPEGKKAIRLSYWATGSQSVDCGTKEVEVRNDRVTEIELDAPPITTDPQSCGAESAQQLQGSLRSIEGAVYLPDGHTPASGAHVAIAASGSNQGVDKSENISQEIADFHLFGRASRTNPDERIADWKGRFLLLQGMSPAEDQEMVEARIPGRFGPALAQAKNALTKDRLRIVLPASVNQLGKVTVGGKEVSEFRAELHVMASREGKDAFNRLFQQFVSADPEGKFEIPALSPGVYQIQAVLDGIWLSASIRVAISADAAPLKPITLDIGAPGPASSIAAVDSQGKPLADQEMNVVRPDGPLARLLWARAFTTDGAGVANIPPLEAGRHVVRIAGIAGEETLVVPSLNDAKSPSARLKVTIRR